MARMNFESAGIAQIWIVVLIAIFTLMLSYTIFYPLVYNTLYDMVECYHGDVALANNIRQFFKIFPLPFLFSILVWGFMSSFKKERDIYLR